MSHTAKAAYESFGVLSIAVWPYLLEIFNNQTKVVLHTRMG
jgi:hypothetical protein